MTARRGAFVERRKALGFTQESLAQSAGVDRSTVARWESGKVDPQEWQRPTLAKVLRVTLTDLDALLYGPGSKSRSTRKPCRFPPCRLSTTMKSRHWSLRAGYRPATSEEIRLNASN
ncbi:helix-turn-helix transcriptional regulator [Streptomyces sp. CBMA156]|uniref:helix-turn-helix transcriptional regulator n=1 Tax=Streptomyces sp. CBMA156 TaxID=1930280 RepID=UPI001CB804D4|nr:helix-turn-helix transcriptional regulator [Streptomyces sp. CBMA156]